MAVVYFKQKEEGGSVIKKMNIARNFHILILGNSRKKHVLAHCLDMDIAAEGKNESQAMKNLTDLIKVQLEYCLENNMLEGAFRPAPRKYWDKFYQSQQKEFIRSFRKSPLKKLKPRYELSYAQG